MRLSLGFSASFAALTLILAGCASTASDTDATSSPVRSITNAEALEDFGQIASSFRHLYGALDRKQARYNFNFELMVDEYRTRIGAATTEAQYRGLFQEFISRFEDPHVSLSAGLGNDASHAYRIPVSVMPVEDTFVVYAVDPSLGDSIKRGDELLSMDGTPAMDLANSWEKYGSVANHRASMHTAAARLMSRASYLSAGIDPNVPVKLRLRGADGAEREVSVAWKESPHVLPPLPQIPAAGESTRKNAMAISSDAVEVTVAELSKMGARVPFFMTPEGRQTLDGAHEVTPSAASLAKFSLTSDAAASINYFAMTYELAGKHVLLVRLPDYTPTDAEGSLNYLRALIDEFQPQVDALVLDETHNPGGSIGFAGAVISLLAKQTYNDYVQQMHADRKWIQSFATEASTAAATDPEAAAIILAQAHSIDAAYSAGKQLSPPIPFINLVPTSDPDPVHWTKPAMMLTDELSVSCADFVPAVVKANGIATIFGQTTMGGGGNVEKVMTLTNTQATLSISRGLGTVYDPTGAYPEELEIEDNGVKPNIAYSHTLADFRAGYVGYIKAFNTALSATLGASAPPVTPATPVTPADPVTP
jgi:hypothetical protein